jgi:hypothetical protein
VQVVLDSVTDYWHDCDIEDAKELLLKKHPGKKKSIEKLFDRAGDLSNTRHELEHGGSYDCSESQYEDKVERLYVALVKLVEG